MKYRVFWDPYAEEQLNLILRGAVNQPQVIAAARTIDTQLAADPFDSSESRFDEFRIAFVRPLAVIFEVIEDVRTVVVCEVWRVK